MSASAGGSVPREYQWIAGTDDSGVAICAELPDPPCPDVATASNGDTIEITGFGTLSVKPKSVTGGGTFVHRNSTGTVLATGTWTVTKLLHFESYGPSPLVEIFPPSFEAGRALMSVHLVALDGTEADANLTVGCILPEVEVPGRLFEGITLKVKGGPNFNQPDLGATLFILQPPD